MLKIFDTIFHIIDYKYKVVENQGYIPEPFLPNDYLKIMSGYQLLGGVIVSGSFQGFDTDYLKEALQVLDNNYVGVINYNPNYTDQQLLDLHKIGVRAIRFNIRRGSKEIIDMLEYGAKRVFELLGWHSELYIDSKDIKNIKNILLNIPRIVIDHLGLSKEGFADVLDLVDHGTYIKASGFGRLNFDPIWAIREVLKINKKACLFGSDLPSTRAQRPFSAQDITLIANSFETDEIEHIFYKNALDLYRLKDNKTHPIE